MEPLESQPQFSAWQIVILLLLLLMTTVGQSILSWLFPGMQQLLNNGIMQVLVPLSCLGLVVILFEQWGVIKLKPNLINSGLTLPLLASFALLYPLLSYF
ncbi:hypothetical protein QWY20_08405 [Alkalimonas sp. MEB108]|uniref:Uncharacterized protein n=1 Tax=Alkalimonas cellulosilytica TaxID=3058395 RepID=A0ABU7J561_9GAMM|nr:hypothetical protein [Alkalimonas sp. MEB108]MEE2001473.1 hypothetical protein [Alkalimonas sp. MEB108]